MNMRTILPTLPKLKELYLDEVDKFLKTYTIPKLTQKEIENLNRPITSKEIESVVKNLPMKKNQGPDGFTGKLYKQFKEELVLIPLKLFQEIENTS